MKVRVLVEQGQPHLEGYIASGEVVELDNQRAKELLDRKEAEPIAEKASVRAEKRPSGQKAEKRG